MLTADKAKEEQKCDHCHNVIRRGTIFIHGKVPDMNAEILYTTWHQSCTWSVLKNISCRVPDVQHAYNYLRSTAANPLYSILLDARKYIKNPRMQSPKLRLCMPHTLPKSVRKQLHAKIEKVRREISSCCSNSQPSWIPTTSSHCLMRSRKNQAS